MSWLGVNDHFRNIVYKCSKLVIMVLLTFLCGKADAAALLSSYILVRIIYHQVKFCLVASRVVSILGQVFNAILEEFADIVLTERDESPWYTDSTNLCRTSI